MKVWNKDQVSRFTVLRNGYVRCQKAEDRNPLSLYPFCYVYYLSLLKVAIYSQVEDLQFVFQLTLDAQRICG